MNEHDKHVIWSVAAVVALLLLALGLSLGWPVWVWLPLCLLVVPAAMVVTRELDRRARPVHPEPEPPDLDLRSAQNEVREAPPAAPPEVTEIESHPIPSAVADYRFRVSAKVHYEPEPTLRSDQLGDLDALARDAIQCRAGEFLRTRQPDEHDCLNDRLSAVLGMARPAHGRVRAWATEVEVRLPENDRKRLDELAEVRKSRQVWEHQREKERDVREYLSTDVFTDPGRALVWWLARELDNNGTKPKELDELLRQVPVLRSLTAATQDKETPQWTDAAEVPHQRIDPPDRATRDDAAPAAPRTDSPVAEKGDECAALDTPTNRPSTAEC